MALAAPPELGYVCKSMTNRSRPSRSSTPTVDATVLRETPTGTAPLRSRVEQQFTDDYFRTIASDLSTSSIGLGTYLGDCTEADDSAYETAIRHAIGAGLNLIDTAINYRCQRSERAVGAAIQQVIASGITTREEVVV